MNYEKLTEDEAMDILKTEYDEREVNMWDDMNHIISPADVLYFADAYGDLESAVLLQGWDKSLPVRAHKGLLDSGADVFEAVECHDLETERCPGCDTEMWQFEIRQGDDYTSTEYLTEYGDVLDIHEIVSNPEGSLWNANPEPDHSPVLCPGCRIDRGWDFPSRLSDSGMINAHYGERDEVSAFSIWNGLIRWDFESRISVRTSGGGDWTDLWGLPGDGAMDIPAEFAIGNQRAALGEHNWGEIDQNTILDDLPEVPLRRSGVRQAFKKTAREWAEGEETHPDLDFTYLIDFYTGLKPRFWVADEDRQQLTDAIVLRVKEMANAV